MNDAPFPTMSSAMSGLSGLSGLTGQGTTYLLFDLFSGVDGTDISAHTPNVNAGGNPYVDADSHWTLLSDQLVAELNLDGVICTIDIEHASFTLSVDVVNRAENFAGVVVRGAGANDYYLIQLRLGNLEVYANVGGSFSQIDTAVIEDNAGQSYLLQLVVTGTTLKTYYDGVLKTTTSIPNNPTATIIGFRQGSSGSGFDPIAFANLSVV